MLPTFETKEESVKFAEIWKDIEAKMSPKHEFIRSFKDWSQKQDKHKFGNVKPLGKHHVNA